MIQQRNAWSTLARLLTGWFCTFSMCALTAAQEATHPLRAGAALANITPPLGEPIVGGFNPLPSDDVHDELHVRALVLTESKSDSAVDRGNEPPAFQPGRTVVIALCDNVGISREVFDQAKKLIEKETGIPAAQVLLAATHTHSATSARSSNAMIIGGPLSDYQAFLSRRIGDAVRLAIKRLAPAKIAWGSVDEPSQLFNRRWFVVEEKERHNPFGGVDQVRMNPGGAATLIRPAGTTDPQISFISVQHADGRPLAILGNYSLHYVGGVPARTISADYFAVFANHLTELLGAQQQDPPFVGMLSNGTSGDVNNINFRERGKSLPNFEKMRQVGQLVAQRVHSAVAQLPHHGWVTLSGQASELELGVRKPTAEMLRVAQEVLAKPESAERHHAQERVYAQRIQLQAEAGPTVMVPLQVLRIAAAADTAAPLQKLGIAAIPFEVFTETGLEIKERSPIKPTFTIELAGGSFGYLPTPPQHALGGYETWLGTNKVEIEASNKIVARLLQLFEQTEAAAHSQASQGK